MITKNLIPIIEYCNSIQLGSQYPQVTGGKHVNMSAASNRIKIEKNDECGRYAVAALPLHVGDILVVEKPCASVIQPEKYSTHCHHCFKT